MPASLLDAVSNPEAEHHLRRYLAEEGSQRYTGRRFEALGGGGDQVATRHVITADDLVAVQMLGVRLPAEIAIDLIEGDLGQRITKLLANIDVAVEIGTPAAAGLITHGSPASQAWTLLTQQHGVDYVIAGKLLARKRPGLIPVYDRVIRCQVGEPDHVWRKLHSQLAMDNEKLRHELAALHVRAGIPASVRVLRVLDVVLWMRHHRQHQARACPGFGTVSLG